MQRQYLQRHHRQPLLVTGIIGIVSAIIVGITNMLLNANATSGTEIFAVETYELMAAKTPPHQWLRSLGGIFMLMLMAGYWHWYVGMATVHRWWFSLTLLLLLLGTVEGTLYHFYFGTPRSCASNTFSANGYYIDAAISGVAMIRSLLTGAINA